MEEKSKCHIQNDLPLNGQLYSHVLRKDFKAVRTIFSTCFPSVASTIFDCYFTYYSIVFGFVDNPNLSGHPTLPMHTNRGSAEVRVIVRT